MVVFNKKKTEDKWKEHIGSYSNINEDIINTLSAQGARQSLRRNPEMPLIPLILEKILTEQFLMKYL